MLILTAAGGSLTADLSSPSMLLRDMPDLLALYGTLMSGLEPRPGVPELSAHIECIGECLLRGRLYDCGPYPGLARGGGTVRGELWRCISAQALSILDTWEDYDPARAEQSVYVRRRVRLVSPGIDAWTYYWNRATDDLAVIVDGDWRAHVARRQRS